METGVEVGVDVVATAVREGEGEEEGLNMGVRMRARGVLGVRVGGEWCARVRVFFSILDTFFISDEHSREDR